MLLVATIVFLQRGGGLQWPTPDGASGGRSSGTTADDARGRGTRGDGQSAKDLSGVADVRDGDSLEIGGSRIRLEGIDAPELAQTCRRNGRVWACGEAARNHLADLISGQRVHCTSHQRDRYQRWLADCHAGGRHLNRQMVDDGMAVSFGRRYGAAEAGARQAGRGLWSSEFQRPQRWRRQNPRQ